MEHEMKAPALTSTSPQTNAAASPRERISRKVRQAIDEMVSGRAKTITAAAEAAGLSREHLSRELSRPHVAKHLRTKVDRHLEIVSAWAGAVKVDLLDSSNEMVRDCASSFVLGLAGIAPQTGQAPVAPGQTPGVVIQIISADQNPPAIDMTPKIITP
jgi:hypothetical protein